MQMRASADAREADLKKALTSAEQRLDSTQKEVPLKLAQKDAETKRLLAAKDAQKDAETKRLLAAKDSQKDAETKRLLAAKEAEHQQSLQAAIARKDAQAEGELRRQLSQVEATKRQSEESLTRKLHEYRESSEAERARLRKQLQDIDSDRRAAAEALKAQLLKMKSATGKSEQNLQVAIQAVESARKESHDRLSNSLRLLQQVSQPHLSPTPLPRHTDMHSLCPLSHQVSTQRDSEVTDEMRELERAVEQRILFPLGRAGSPHKEAIVIQAPPPFAPSPPSSSDRRPVPARDGHNPPEKLTFVHPSSTGGNYPGEPSE